MEPEKITKAASILSELMRRQKHLQAYIRAAIIRRSGMYDLADKHTMDTFGLSFNEARRSPLFKNPEVTLKSITNQIADVQTPKLPKPPKQLDLF